MIETVDIPVTLPDGSEIKIPVDKALLSSPERLPGVIEGALRARERIKTYNDPNAPWRAQEAARQVKESGPGSVALSQMDAVARGAAGLPQGLLDTAKGLFTQPLDTLKGLATGTRDLVNTPLRGGYALLAQKGMVPDVMPGPSPEEWQSHAANAGGMLAGSLMGGEGAGPETLESLQRAGKLLDNTGVKAVNAVTTPDALLARRAANKTPLPPAGYGSIAIPGMIGAGIGRAITPGYEGAAIGAGAAEVANVIRRSQVYRNAKAAALDKIAQYASKNDVAPAISTAPAGPSEQIPFGGIPESAPQPTSARVSPAIQQIERKLLGGRAGSEEARVLAAERAPEMAADPAFNRAFSQQQFDGAILQKMENAKTMLDRADGLVPEGLTVAKAPLLADIEALKDRFRVAGKPEEYTSLNKDALTALDDIKEEIDHQPDQIEWAKLKDIRQKLDDNVRLEGGFKEGPDMASTRADRARQTAERRAVNLIRRTLADALPEGPIRNAMQQANAEYSKAADMGLISKMHYGLRRRVTDIGSTPKSTIPP